MSNRTEVKIILVGDTNVGKTSISTRYITKKFQSESEPTIGAGFFSRELVIQGVNCTLTIWDTAGQEEYRYLVPVYYRNAAIAIVVFDQTNHSTFVSVPSWIEDVQKNAGQDVILVLCGNKTDIEPKMVDSEKILEIENKYGLIYIETSAITGYGISKLFEVAVTEYLKQHKALFEAKDNVDLIPAVESKKQCC